MAQFRTTADVKTEVLQKAGEPTNGNSSYASRVMTYINKAHQAIVGGGSIFSVKVDEAWKWAYAKRPIVLELQPAYRTGTCMVIAEGRSITFSSPPDFSLEGWFIKFVGDTTVYRITQHTLSVADGTLDAGFMGVSGTYNFTAFKLDYEVSPRYLTIDYTNDKLNFIETGTTELTATFTHGSYTPEEFAIHATTVINAVATASNTYAVTYDDVLKLFTLTSNLSGMGTVFKLLGATGTNRKRSTLPVFGLDQKDHTGAASYVSTYVICGISRLVEPFKVFKVQKSPFIESADPVNMECEYPLSSIRERTPVCFAKMTEDNSGQVVVRFNSYPAERMKVEVNWIPIPYDLQDNDASIPLIPRKDIDALIHGAAAFIQYDKEDTKFADTMALVDKQLQAMEKKNRSEAFRTQENYGQIVPRADLVRQRKNFIYGYENSTSSASQQNGGTSFPIMAKTTFTYADFSDASGLKTIVARNLAANRSLFAVLVKHSVIFSGGTVSGITLDVGIGGDLTKFVNAFDLAQAVSNGAQESVIVFYFPASATDLVITARCTGDTLNHLSQGSVDVYFQELGVS